MEEVEPNLGIPKAKETRVKEVDEKAKQVALDYLKRLPKMPSHYCRAGSSKLYIDTDFENIRELYKHYTKTCEERNEPTYGRTQFTKLFENQNLAFYQPKKDQCDLCVGYKTKTVDENEYVQHIKRKSEAQNSKALDKENVKRGTCCSHDGPSESFTLS